MQVSQNEENLEVVSSVQETSGGEEIRRKWTRFRYFGVRIAHRWSRTSDLPHDSFFSSDESFHSYTRTVTLTRVRIVDPSATERTYSVAWLQSEHTMVKEIILSRKSNGNKVRANAQGLYFPYFSFRKIETNILDRLVAISYNQTFPINVRKYYVCVLIRKYLLIKNILYAYLCLKLWFMSLIIKIIF